MAAILASQAALASMINTIPVMVVGGMVYKMQESMLPQPKPTVLRTTKRRPRVVNPYNRDYFGGF